MRALFLVVLMASFITQASRAQVVQTDRGPIEGITAASGIQIFRGIPYAAPPVRDLRWQPPQPVEEWMEVRKADRFGPQCMQRRIFDDMVFRSEGTSEDCLYLNVWTPEASADAKRPVLVYFYGGGFLAGDGSEPRYDGESMARENIVVVTMNYRLGIFGFFAHPELSEKSPHGGSGNYGLLDQAQAMLWVQQNIEAFGGDPDQITIAGESAGSISVSAQMVSPLSKHLIRHAIGESGSLLGTLSPNTLEEAEGRGLQFAEKIGASSIDELRALSATRLMDLAAEPGTGRFGLTIDGYFFPKAPAALYAEGEQAPVPLLLGWNTQESSYQAILGQDAPTPENYEAALRRLYGDQADEALEVYDADTREEVIQAATDLAGDRFIGFSTWKWYDLHRRSGAPVYRYLYAHPRPPMVSAGDDAAPARGAVHSAEIEYALGNLDANPIYAWTPDDYTVSHVMKAYFANFIKTGDPNGSGLPRWPESASTEPPAYMRIDVESSARQAEHRDRYLFLDQSFQD